jgi:hypothetical protein
MELASTSLLDERGHPSRTTRGYDVPMRYGGLAAGKALEVRIPYAAVG